MSQPPRLINASGPTLTKPSMLPSRIAGTIASLLTLIAAPSAFADTLIWAIPLDQTIAKPVNLRDKTIDGIVRRRARTEFPKGLSVVPERLQPLVMDFAIMFDELSTPGVRARCGDYRFVEIRAAQPGPNANESASSEHSEVWSIDACGTRLAFKVDLLACNSTLNSSMVRVKTAFTKSGAFLGANPLDATFLVSCPDSNLHP